MTAFKEEKVQMLLMLIDIERLLSTGDSDDFERYIKLGLQIAPEHSYFHIRNGKLS